MCFGITPNDIFNLAQLYSLLRVTAGEYVLAAWIVTIYRDWKKYKILLNDDIITNKSTIIYFIKESLITMTKKQNSLNSLISITKTASLLKQ